MNVRRRMTTLPGSACARGLHASRVVEILSHGSAIIPTVSVEPASERLIGRRLLRQEDPRLVTGKGAYATDLALPGMLHMAVLRSPHAHARIVRVDADRARRVP